MLYWYVLGCGLACLTVMGVSSMETVCVRPGRAVIEIFAWPLALAWWLASRKRR